MYFFQELYEGLSISFRAIRANKMRSILTTLGIVIGIVSVTVMATAIEGINRAFDRSAAAFGTDVLYVQKWPWVSNEDWSVIRNRRNIKVQYAAKLERQATLIDAVAPVIGTVRRVSYGSNSVESAFISGTTNQYLNASGGTISDGRFFTAEESAGGRPVCTVGASIVENLFYNVDPIGKTIRVAGYPYTIVGVFEKQGGLFGTFTTDSRVFVPLISFENHFGARRDVTIQVRVADTKEMEDAKLEVEGIMRQIRDLPPGKPNDFNVNQQELLVQVFGPISLVICHDRPFYYRPFPLCRRHRHHEHHVRLCHGADERNRHPQSHRGKTKNDPYAVPCGIGVDLSDRRADRAWRSRFRSASL